MLTENLLFAGFWRPGGGGPRMQIYNDQPQKVIYLIYKNALKPE